MNRTPIALTAVSLVGLALSGCSAAASDVELPRNVGSNVSHQAAARTASAMPADWVGYAENIEYDENDFPYADEGILEGHLDEYDDLAQYEGDYYYDDQWWGEDPFAYDEYGEDWYSDEYYADDVPVQEPAGDPGGAPYLTTTEAVPGYELSPDDGFEGFYPLLNGDNGCLVEVRPVNAAISDEFLGTDDPSSWMAADLLGYLGADYGQTEPLIVGAAEDTFMGAFGALETGEQVAVASKYEIVVGSEGEYRARGLDTLVTCPAGVDAGTEFLTIAPLLELQGW